MPVAVSSRIAEAVSSLAGGCTVQVTVCFDRELNSKIEIQEKETDGETLRSFGKIRKVKGRMEKKKQGYVPKSTERPNQRLQVNITILSFKNHVPIWAAIP